MTIRVACVTARVEVGARSLFVTSMLFLVLALAASAYAEPLFSAPFLSFDTGLAPRAVAIADMNADGHPDMVSANIGYSGLNTVSVLLGTGDGTYAPRNEYASGTGLNCDLRFCPIVPFSVAVGDLNADGKLDVAVGDPKSNTASVLLGNGDGTLAPKTSFGTGSSPVSVAIADLNGDGRPDLTVANKGSSSVSVLLGNGDGTFGPKTDFGTGSGPASVAIADLNADGRLDLVTANNGGGLGNTVSVLLGNGNGTFGGASAYATTSGPLSLAIGDLDADGRLDLAVACGDYGAHDPHDPTVYPSPSVTVLLGNGDGTLSNVAVNNNSGMAVAIADVNADGHPDLVAGGSGVWLLPGNGDGTFGAGTISVAGGGVSVAVGDVNGDGRADVAAAGGATVSVLLGNGNDTFGGGNAYSSGGFTLSVAAGDLNGDGRLDLAATIWTSGVSVMLGNGDGTFGSGSYFATGDAPWDVVLADLNADGRLDMAVANLYSSTAAVLLGNGDGTFGPKTDYTGSSSVAIGDVNADGRPDLVTTNYSSGGFGLGNTVSVMLGNGDGTFGPPANFGTGTGPQKVAIADLNADGRLDLVVANYQQNSGNTVSVLLGNGDGTFGPKTDFPTGTGTYFVAIGDLNADGRPDLAVANYSPSAVSILLGNGDGTFGTRTVVGAGAQPISVAIADLNRDGRPDLAVANRSSNTVSVLPGNGDGTFAPKMDFGVGVAPYSATIADVNGDGLPDLVSANSSGTVAVLLHTGGHAVSVPTPSEPVAESALKLLSSNPSRAASRMQYSVARAGHVRLEVIDITGRVVTILFDGVQQSGHFHAAWDGTGRGGRLPAGLYFIRLETPDRTVAKRITRLL